MPLTVGSRLGPYSVTAKIREGGMGEPANKHMFSRTGSSRRNDRFWGAKVNPSLHRCVAHLGHGERHRGPDCESSRPQHSMMNRSQVVPPHSKQILNDAVHVEETLRVVA